MKIIQSYGFASVGKLLRNVRHDSLRNLAMTKRLFSVSFYI
ncbi:hypothetical protein [Helicobacter sp.]|nr:hypothetical protein [Helicobacter sp.]